MFAFLQQQCFCVDWHSVSCSKKSIFEKINSLFWNKARLPELLSMQYRSSTEAPISWFFHKKTSVSVTTLNRISWSRISNKKLPTFRYLLVATVNLNCCLSRDQPSRRRTWRHALWLCQTCCLTWQSHIWQSRGLCVLD